MDLLQLMVRLVEELSLLKVPIVFKGAVVLKTALFGYRLDTERATRDIDGDWIGEPPSMEQLNKIINTALLNVGATFTAVPHREYGQGRSAGFTVLDDGNKIFAIDISIKNNPFCCQYITFNGVQFVGASAAKMFADKMHGISSNLVFRRGKDVYDLYLLSTLTGYTTQEIYTILNTIGRTL